MPVSEPWTVLAAAAMATRHVRLGTLVTPVARRRPWVLARQVTTVDHLSGGRAVLGVGLGVPPGAEYGVSASHPTPAATPRSSTRGSISSAPCGRASPSTTTASTITSPT